MKNIKHFVAMVICVLGLFLPMFSNAAQKEKDCALTLECEAAGTEISLYQITEGLEEEAYKLTSDFKGYCNKVKGLDELETLEAEGWRSLAGTLEECVLADKIKPHSKKKVGEKGTVTWTGLSRGLYLVVGTQTNDKYFRYTPSPMIIMLPKQTDAGSWDNHGVIKYNKFEKEELKKTTSIEVMKIWKDSENKKSRPSEVTIELLRDGKSYDTVKLNVKNNWKYQWSDLSSENRWTIREKDTSSSYRVEYSKTGNKVYVINHYKKTDISEKKDTPKKTKLPQTGQLWWPVPILAIIGFAVWMIGWMKRRTYVR